MSQQFGSGVELFEGGIPEGYDKFQIVLSGNADPERDQAELSFYIVAEKEEHAAGYAYELMERRGYTEVSITSESEAQDRRTIGYESYEFSFPSPENIVLVEAPDWGTHIPEIVLVLNEEKVEELFDPIARKKRERARVKEEREERRGRATPLRGRKK